MNERERSDQTRGPRRGKTRTSIHLVLNWTHMSVFVAVAALGLITLNQGFAGIDQRIDSLDSRLGRVEDELSDMNARLSVVEFIVRAGAGTEAESPTTAGASIPDC